MVVEGHIQIMPSAEGNHIIVHRYAEGVDVDLFLIERDLGREAVHFVLGLLTKHQQLGDLREGLAIQHDEVLTEYGAGSAQRGGFDRVVLTHVGLGCEVELGLTAERLEHRQHRIDLRNHTDEFLDIDIQHVVVKSHIEVVLTGRAVHSGELHLSRLAHKSHLFQHQRTVLDVETTREVAYALVEHIGLIDLGIERQINRGGHQEGLGFCRFRSWRSFRRFRSLRSFRCLLAAFVGGEEGHQFVDVRVLRGEGEFALEDALMLHPLTHIGHFAHECEVGVADMELRGLDREAAVGVVEGDLRDTDIAVEHRGANQRRVQVYTYQRVQL